MLLCCTGSERTARNNNFLSFVTGVYIYRVPTKMHKFFPLATIRILQLDYFALIDIVIGGVLLYHRLRSTVVIMCV